MALSIMKHLCLHLNTTQLDDDYIISDVVQTPATIPHFMSLSHLMPSCQHAIQKVIGKNKCDVHTNNFHTKVLRLIEEEMHIKRTKQQNKVIVLSTVMN